MLTRLLSVVLTTLLTAAVALVAAPASACACGGIASSDLAASVNGETAIVTRVGARETIDMRLSMQSVAADAALIIPTPTPAVVSAGSTADFTRYAAITAPLVETRTHWWTPSGGRDGAVGSRAPGSGATGAPTVVQQVTLGPLEATVLRGGDLAGLRQWLSDNGYQLKPAISDAMAPYVADHWSFVAIRLSSTTPLSGPLDPVRLTFESDRLVYPMRMSSAATSPQQVKLYVVADHRQQRVDADAATQSVTTDYAGRLDDRFLTALTTTITQPSRIATDFVFADAASDEPYQRVTYTDADVTIFGVMAGPFLVGIALLGVVVAGAIFLVFRRGTRR